MNGIQKPGQMSPHNAVHASQHGTKHIQSSQHTYSKPSKADHLDHPLVLDFPFLNEHNFHTDHFTPMPSSVQLKRGFIPPHNTRYTYENHCRYCLFLLDLTFVDFLGAA